jgi:hypothetical protein
VDEEHLIRRHKLVRERSESSEDAGSRDTGAGKSVETCSGREGAQASAGRCDELDDPLVIGVDKFGGGFQLERRLKGDDRRVDAVAVEERQPLFNVVSAEVDREAPFS